MQAIHLLEQYCRSNNIKLIWSSWHTDTVNALSNDKENIFSNIVFNKDLVIDYHLANINKSKIKNLMKTVIKNMKIILNTVFILVVMLKMG